MTARTDLSDRAVARIRTTVPALWGSVVAALLTWLGPHLPVDVVAALGDWLSGEAAIGLVTTVTIAAWYWLWQWLSPHVPDWLVRIVLGSPATPTYTPVPVDGPVLTSDERTNLGSLAAALDPGDPGRDALERVLQQ